VTTLLDSIVLRLRWGILELAVFELENMLNFY